MPLLSPRPPPPNVSPGVTPSHSPVNMKVSHLLTSPGSSTAPLSLPRTLVSPPQSCAQNSCLALWKRVREGHTLVVQVTLLVVAVVTLRSLYKVSAACHIFKTTVMVQVLTLLPGLPMRVSDQNSYNQKLGSGKTHIYAHTCTRTPHPNGSLSDLY